jgi:hypothetical protein
MAIFDPMQVIPEDLGSLGVWLNSHSLEHQQLNQAALKLGNTELPYFDLGIPPRDQTWLDNHQTMTEAISSMFGLPTPDLSQIDLEDESSWRQWENDNANWHMVARSIIGLI